MCRGSSFITPPTSMVIACGRSAPCEFARGNRSSKAVHRQAIGGSSSGRPHHARKGCARRSMRDRLFFCAIGSMRRGFCCCSRCWASIRHAPSEGRGGACAMSLFFHSAGRGFIQASMRRNLTRAIWASAIRAGLRWLRCTFTALQVIQTRMLRWPNPKRPHRRFPSCRQ